jgi:hypothetical protein
LGRKLKNVSLRETVLANGSEKIFISVENAGAFEDMN